MLPWILAFVIIDLVVTALVVRHILVRRAAARAAAVPGDGAAVAIPDLGKLREFTDAMHPRLGEFVRANWSGDSMALPDVLGMALDMTEREARARELPLGRDVLKRLIESSMQKHGVARDAQIRSALKQVA